MTLPIEKQIKNKAKTKKILKQSLIHLILIIAVCVLLYPVACTVFVSLKSTKEALLSPNTFPTEFHFENFVEAWNVMNYPRVFLNTVLVTAGGLVGVVFISSAAAYTIAWSKHIKLYTFFYVFFLCGIMIPFHTSLVPLVNLMADIKFNDVCVFVRWFHQRYFERDSRGCEDRWRQSVPDLPENPVPDDETHHLYHHCFGRAGVLE